MRNIADVVNRFPIDLQEPMFFFWEIIQDELGVKREDFTELKNIVLQLAQAQNRTEIQVKELTEAQKRTEIRVEELVEAEKRTEIRIEELAGAQKELTEAQKRTEIQVKELAEAEKRTEIRMEELAGAQKELTEAQKRTEIKVEELVGAQKELTEAQKKTENVIQKLSYGLNETNRRVGGLAMTVGYTLEDKAYKALPKLLERDYGVRTLERLIRGYLSDKKGQDVEVNILGNAEKNGEKLLIIGESKSQLSKNDVKRFIERRLNNFDNIGAKIFPILITYMETQRGVAEYARSNGIAVYFSYDFDN